jgi:hypothetical protein
MPTPKPPYPAEILLRFHLPLSLLACVGWGKFDYREWELLKCH